MAELFDKDFRTRIIGAVLGGFADTALEFPFWVDPTTAGKFPYIKIADPIPPCDDLIVTGVTAIPYVIGHYKKDEKIKKVGEGALGYGLPMIVRGFTNDIIRTVRG